MRLVRTHGVSINTSLGRITGEIWSDGLIALGTEDRDVDADDFKGLEDLVRVLRELELPPDEAASVAEEIWRGGLASFASRFAKPS